MKALWNDEAGVIISAELVLVATILVMGMIVGLVELQCAVVGELTDLGDAVGNFDQSYTTVGILSTKNGGGTKAATYGASYDDKADTCDCNSVVVCAAGGQNGEKSSFH